MKQTRQLTRAAFFLALAIVLPSLFHLSGIDGRVFLPMHIPVLMAGFFLSPPAAAVVGFLAPFLSSMATGMPVLFPIAVIMSVELALYGGAASLLARNGKSRPVAVLIAAMVMGRLGAGLCVYGLALFFGVKLDALLYLKGAVLAGLPGIAIQLVLIPLLLRLLPDPGRDRR